MATNAIAVTGDTLITIKLAVDGSNRKFQLPLKDLNDTVFAEKLRSILQVLKDQKLILERYSDSSSSYVLLDSKNPSAYKQLYRAAKAKLRLRIKATVVDEAVVAATAASSSTQTERQTTEASSTTEETKPIPIVRPIDIDSQAARDAFFAQLAVIARKREAGRHSQEAPAPVATTTWQVYCNHCDKAMTNVHYHCSICDGGDYDLCDECVAAGKVCPGDSHWLIKRCVLDGKVVNSTTQWVSRKQSEVVAEKLPTGTTTDVQSVAGKTEDMPGTFQPEAKSEAPMLQLKRTCNNCVAVLPEKSLVTCNECEDYDLCIPCHVQNKHGHHPAHSFKPTCEETTLTAQAKSLCSAGRNVRHAAICDGCDESIFGVRHKCLDCPDWDFCSTCVKTARLTHRGHRFTPIYEALNFAAASKTRHFGIYCDGPLCSKKNSAHITGVRYKCSICDDTDFCANCEAHPRNTHNQTHPMIKFKTAVRNVSITTLGENQHGQALPQMGDRKVGRVANQPATTGNCSHPATTATSPPPYTAHAGPSHAVAEVAKPTRSVVTARASSETPEAHFVHDTIADGSQFPPSTGFVQSWTLRNPGPHAWPVGCTVDFAGGDVMFNSFSPPAPRTNATDRAVLPNESYIFSVPLFSPGVEGKRISYWRLKSPEGVVFGHKLWCDINVKIAQSDALAYYQKELKTMETQNARRIQQNRLAMAQQIILHQQQCAAARLAQNQGNDHTGGIRARLRELQLHEHRQSVRTGMAQNTAPPATNMPKSHDAMQIANILNTIPADVPSGLAGRVSASEALPTPSDKHIAASVEKEFASESSSNLEGSQMIFPTLEKESPMSSMYVAPSGPSAADATEDPTVTVETAKPRVATVENDEDLDTLDLDGSEDDGFLTDEEYDILDASDEEISKA